MDPFPNGWTSYLVGGLLIGAAVSGIFWTTGIRAGASGVFTTGWTWVSRLPYLGRAEFREDRVWRLVFSAGLVGGAAVYASVHGWSPATRVSLTRLFLGGLLVGFGTRLSRGCTSGHGICGLAAGQRSSLIAVVVFMGVAIVVAQSLRALGVVQ